MKKGIVISDAGPIFSLALIDQLQILTSLFGGIHIPKAVWDELTRDKSSIHYQKITEYFADKVIEISGFNDLTFIMDYGESEAVILYRELDADFLLIDDKKARSIAENFGIKCIGTLGLLVLANQKGILNELRPYFKDFIQNNRYYGLNLLNSILRQAGENEL